MQLNGAQIIIECLKEQGVDVIFGYPGGANLNFFDELSKQQQIRHVLTSHEQGASHAADGYARATGKVGVCCATSGPGATNLVTGIATAYMDSIPVIAITGNVSTAFLGKNSFQEVDIVSVVKPITKYSVIVKDVNDLADTLRKAFYIARKGRPGPVLVDIPKDLTIDMADFISQEIKLPERQKETITDRDIQKAIELISKAKKPFVFVGGGAVLSGASEEVRRFVELVDAPVCDTLMGKGAFDGRSNRYTGMLGMHGTKASNLGVSECDLLIAIGSRFSDRVLGNPKTFARHAKVLHLDIDPAEINKNIAAHVSVIGDIKEILDRINAELPQQFHTEWNCHIDLYKEKYPLAYSSRGLSCPYIIEKIYEMTKGDAIITTEVGQHQIWTAQHYKYKEPRILLTSGGLGTMGYGLGASIGASIGRPDKQVINIAGDGCFRMNMNEIITACREKLPLIQVIINNHVLGMVRQWQSLFYNQHYCTHMLDDGADFVKISEGMGAKAKKVTSKEEFEKAFEEAMDAKVPYVLDCNIDYNDKVWPMVAPGGSIEEVFDENEQWDKADYFV